MVLTTTMRSPFSKYLLLVLSVHLSDAVERCGTLLPDLNDYKAANAAHKYRQREEKADE
jgi:hypothetical protein